MKLSVFCHRAKKLCFTAFYWCKHLKAVGCLQQTGSLIYTNSFPAQQQGDFMGKFYSKHYANGLPDAVYEDGKVWRNYYANGLPDAVYEDGKIWFSYYANGLPDAVYEDGKIWKKYYANGLPDAVYEDGKVWNNYYANGLPDAVYEGSDAGAAACAALLLL